MRAYVAVTGVVFGLVTSAHVWRIAVEGQHLLEDPVWVILTIIAAALGLWAIRLLWRSRRPGRT